MKSALRDWLSMSYGMKNNSADWLAALASPYPASPDFSTGKRVTRFSGRFAPLRIVFPCHPYAGDRIKHLESSLRKRLCSKHGLLCHLEEGERWWRQPPKGECVSTPARAVVWFSDGRKPGCEGFIQTGAFYKFQAPYNNPRAKGASNLSPLRTFGPKGRQPSSPKGACP